jgi:hypothetical protein
MMAMPSDTLIAMSCAETTIKDSNGRLLSVRRMGALDRLRLFKAIGSQLSENPPYLGMAMLAASVTAIDQVPVPAPTTEAQVEALVHKLGDEGIAAVADCLEPSDAEFTDAGN